VAAGDGAPAIVKELKPIGIEDELRGAHYLAWRGGEGAIRLLALDGTRMLIEFAGDTTLVDHLGRQGDGAATAVAALVLSRLHSPSNAPAPGDLQPLRRWLAGLFDKAAAERQAGRPGLYQEGAAIAERLLSNRADVRPLHGDLHHLNVIHGPRGWLAIDPKGLIGDPAFDAANFFFNPLDRDDLCLSPERIAFMARSFAGALHRDVATILDFAFAYGCLSAAWHAGDDNDVEERRTLLVAAAIRNVREFSA
jgi:streptomycin 6-kinase